MTPDQIQARAFLMPFSPPPNDSIISGVGSGISCGNFVLNRSRRPFQKPRPSSPLPSPNFPPSPGRTQRRRSANAPTKHLRVEERAYFAVSATLDVLVLLLDYLKVIVNLPTLTMDTMSRVIELLKSFNSRTCQVVLGAGAMRSAGLKNITAKHLGPSVCYAGFFRRGRS